MAVVHVLAQAPIQATSAGAWLAAGVALLLLMAWLLFGRGPRRRRRYSRARRQLRLGHWQTALAEITPERRAGHSPAWQQSLCKLEADCHALAGEQALSQKEYELCLDHHVRAAQLFHLDADAVRTRLFETMLSDLRRRFADGADVQNLGDRLLKLFPTCAEGLFWQALDDVRRGQVVTAIDKLRSACDLTDSTLDPPLYLGTLLLRQGETAEARRHLATAHRLATGCPLASWQRGTALLAPQGEPMLAVGLLEFAVGTNGLPRWLHQAAQLWTNGYADASHAYIPRLAAEHVFQCPVFGTDVASMLQQARLALAQAHERLKQFKQAAGIYVGLVRDYPPTMPVLRGLGLTLARLGRYDEAFTHLRTVHAREPERDPLVAAYLALCAARGKPLRPEDRVENLRWGLGLLRQFDVNGDEEWAAVYAAVACEVRNAGPILSADDVQRLCTTLVSVSAVTPDAGCAYADLVRTVPEALRAEHARLYGKAAVSHRLVTTAELRLFAKLFEDEAGATAEYAARGWDLDEVRAYYLERHAAARPGSFPDGLPDAAGFLLHRSQAQEKLGQFEPALNSATLLLRLAPHWPQALDRLAYLHYQRGELERAAALLAEWETVEPENSTPIVRRAVIEHTLGRSVDSAAAITRALALSTGQARARIATLGGRLALSVPPPGLAGASARDGPGSRFTLSLHRTDLERAERCLEECLETYPEDAQALARLAAVRSLLGEQRKLAEQAPAMQRPDVGEPSFHYLAATCHLAAGAPAAALHAADRAALDPAWVRESAYLRARARLDLHDDAGAVHELNDVLARSADYRLADYALALLGRAHFAAGRYAAAARCWDTLSPERRVAWQLDEPLQQTLYVTGVTALCGSQFEDALPWLQAAANKGVACSALLNRARWCAAEQAPPQRAIELLEAMIAQGPAGPHVFYRLALACKGVERWTEARHALKALPPGDAESNFQLGLLALHENQLDRAEVELTRAWATGFDCFACGFNLLMTRLSLGRCEQCAALAHDVAQRAPDPAWQRLLAQLACLVELDCPANGAGQLDPVMAQMSAAEEQRLVDLVGKIGHPECANRLLHALRIVRHESQVVRDAEFETHLLRAQALISCCYWSEARGLLTLRTGEAVSRPLAVAGLNLRGVCECLMQDFAGGRQSFEAALRFGGNDARLWQNLALVCEWQQRPDEAATHWQRFVNALNDRLSVPPEPADYRARLACAALSRLAAGHAAHRSWSEAKACFERAHQFWPASTQVLDGLFQVYRQTGDFDEAHRLLDGLQQQCPERAQYEVYRLDLIELVTPDDVEQVLAGVQRLGQKFPDDPQVEASLALVLGHAVAGLVQLHERLSGQLARARARLRRLPSFEVDWDEVEDFARRLHRRLLKLKCVVDRGVLLTAGEDQQRLRDVSQQLTRQAAHCRRLVH